MTAVPSGHRKATSRIGPCQQGTEREAGEQPLGSVRQHPADSAARSLSEGAIRVDGGSPAWSRLEETARRR
jgi:hypothetical protein